MYLSKMYEKDIYVTEKAYTSIPVSHENLIIRIIDKVKENCQLKFLDCPIVMSKLSRSSVRCSVEELSWGLLDYH